MNRKFSILTILIGLSLLVLVAPKLVVYASTPITSSTTSVAVASSFTYPMPSSQVSFTIGYGIHPNIAGNNGCYWDSSTGQYVPWNQLWHSGEDWFANTPANSTPIYAVANGVVKYVSPSSYSYPGAVIIIEHMLLGGSPVYSMYAHLDPTKILITKGQTVNIGAEIASGLIVQTNPDGSDNTHLHWEIRYFFDGSGITKGPNYTQSCSAQPGPGYTWPGQPDNFIFNGITYQWTNPSQFIASHLITQKSIYFGSGGGKVYALKPSNGSLQWVNQTRTGQSTGSIDTAPAIANGNVYVGSANSSFYAIKQSDGSSLWSYTTGGAIISSPVVANGIVYFGSFDNYFYALNAADGSLLWRYQTGNSIKAPSQVHNGTVYFGSEDGYFYALNATNGSLLWRFQTQSGFASVETPTLVNGVIYVSSNDYFGGAVNYLYALQASTGTLLWRYQTTYRQSMMMAVVNGIGYFGTFDNYMNALNLSNLSLLWRYKVGNIPTSPTTNKGVVYFGSCDDSEYALKGTDGSLLWSYKTGGPICGTVEAPTVFNGVVYIGSEDNYEYALNATSGSLIWHYGTDGQLEGTATVASF